MGVLTTRPLRFSGSRLFVNLDAPKGALQAEAIDDKGAVLATLGPVTGNGTLLPAKGDLSGLAGKALRFRFRLTRGSLYAFWVSPDDSGASRGYVGAGGPGYPGPVDTTGSPAREK